MNPPNCAQSCLNAVYQSNGCNNLDLGCLCKSNIYIQDVFTCLYQSCSPSDVTATEAWAQSVCNPIGVTLDFNSYTTNLSFPSSTSMTVATTATTTTTNNLPLTTTTPSTLITTTSPALSPTSNNSSSSTITSIPNQQPGPSSSSSSAGSGLTLGDKLAIGLAVPLGTILIAVVIFFAFRRYYRFQFLVAPRKGDHSAAAGDGDGDGGPQSPRLGSMTPHPMSPLPSPYYTDRTPGEVDRAELSPDPMTMDGQPRGGGGGGGEDVAETEAKVAAAAAAARLSGGSAVSEKKFHLTELPA